MCYERGPESMRGLSGLVLRAVTPFRGIRGIRRRVPNWRRLQCKTEFQTPPKTVDLLIVLHFGTSRVPELKRYARRVSRTQAIRSLFFEIAEGSTFWGTRNFFSNVLQFFWFFRLRSGRVRNAVDLDCVNGPGPPPTVQICYYLQHFGAPSVPELKRYACRASRPQAIRSLFFNIAESSTLSETRNGSEMRWN